MMRRNDELNKAIWTVLTTQFKKDAKEAFKMVEENGYDVYKNGWGTWSIANPTTKRSLYIGYGKYGSRATLYCGNHTTLTKTWRTISSKEEREVAEKFDFVNCLNTPVNVTYYEMRMDESRESKALLNYYKLKSAKSSINYESEDIDRIQKKIAELQADLIRATEKKVKADMKLNEVRKELGLVK